MPDAEGLAQIYAAAAGRAKTALLAVDPARYSPALAARAMAEVRKAVATLNQRSIDWTDDAIEQAWEQGAATATVALEILGRTRVLDPNLQNREKLKDALARTLLRANRSIVTSAQDFLGLTAMAKKAIDGAELQEFDFEAAEGRMSELAAQAVKNESSRKVLAGQIRKDLAGEISAGNLIQIKGKQWRADRYAETVARTTMREAQTEATLELCREYENDLVQWSDHGTQCPDCATYEGNIYSISGKHPTYPMLTESPPLHPNCEHSLLPTSDPALEIRKAGPGKTGSYLEGATWLAQQPVAAKAKRKPREKKPKPEPKPVSVSPTAKGAPWQEFKTVGEAQEWATNNLLMEGGKGVDYSQCPIEFANIINREFAKVTELGYQGLYKIGPATDLSDAVMYVRRKSEYIDTKTAHGFRVRSTPSVTLAYNPRDCGDWAKLNKMLKNWDRTGWQIGHTPTSLIQHELGHALDDLRAMKMGLNWARNEGWVSQGVYDSWASQFKNAKDLRAARAMIKHRDSGQYMWVWKSGTTKQNVNEFMAEAYRLYRQGKLPAGFEEVAKTFESLGW